MRGPSDRSASASHTSRGPLSLPPMPMLMTSAIGRPVAPFHAPERTSFANARRRSSSACTAWTTEPGAPNASSTGARKAMCRAARRSLALTGSPLAMDRCTPMTSRSTARRRSSARASASSRWREKSSAIPQADRSAPLWDASRNSACASGARCWSRPATASEWFRGIQAHAVLLVGAATPGSQLQSAPAVLHPQNGSCAVGATAMIARRNAA